MTKARLISVMVAALAVSACGSQSSAPAPEQTAAAPEAAGNIEIPAIDNAATPGNATVADAGAAAGPAAPAAFTPCKTCHTANKDGKPGVGPNLWGVAGGKAAQKAGFAYSDKLKAAGLTWDDATLDKWISGPMKLVPGTKMTFAGEADAAKRQEIITYLKSLH